MTDTETRICLDRFASHGEADMARKLIREILDRGIFVSIDDGEAVTLAHSRDFDAIIAAMCTTEMDIIIMRDDDKHVLGSFLLVYGNAEDGSELASDWQDNGLCQGIFEKVFL